MKRLATLCLVFLVGCGAIPERPEIDGIAKGIAVAAADLEAVAVTTRQLCGNTVPDGPCASTGLISTATKTDLKERIQDGLDALKLANFALETDEGIDADDHLSRAEAILLLLEAQLTNYEN